MLALRLAVRALFWRSAASATVFVVALIGIAAAAVGPIYLHAVDQTVLSERLTQAPQNQRDVLVTRSTLIGSSDVDWHATIDGLAREVADPRWFDQPVYSEEAQLAYRGLTRYNTQFAAIDDLCAHLHVVSGHCVDSSAGAQTVITERTARAQHLVVGDVLAPVPAANVVAVKVKVVGIVTPIHEHGAFWSPWDYFNAEPALSDGMIPRVDSFFVSHAFLAEHERDMAQTIAANVRLRAQRVRLDDLDPLRADIQRVQDSAAQAHEGADGLSKPTVGSQLPTVLDGMSKEMSLARTLIVLPTAQLVLLAIFILYAVVAGTTSVQGHEVALAKLRGRKTRSVLFQGVAQPILLVLVAAPIAATIAWLIVRAVANGLLGREVGVAFPVSAVQVVAATTLASVAAAVVAARRIVVTPVGQLLRRGTDTSNTSVGLALADAAIVTLALAGLVELAATGTLDSGRTNPLSALAPTLLGIALAIAVLRLLPYVGRALVRATSESRRLASFLAVRQIVRRPAGARVVVLIGVALSLATFAVINWSVAGANRQERAVNQAGAVTVLDVAADDRVPDLRTAVAKADPDGHSMAAAIVQVDRSTPLLAVDTARFAGVAAWAPGNSATQLSAILRKLAAPAQRSLAFTGTELRLDVNLTATPPKRAVTLTAFVTGADHRRSSYAFGTVHAGAGSYQQSMPPICESSCRITGLTLQAAGPARPEDAAQVATSIAATVSAQARSGGAWRPVAGFDDPARWRDDGAGLATVTRSGSALGITLRQSAPEGPWSTLLSADTPSHVPAVLASQTASSYPGPAVHDASTFGLDDATLAIDGVATSVALPSLDRLGAMIDFGAALNAMSTPVSSQTQLAVFVAADGPSDMAARLAEQGIRVTDTVRASEFRTELDRTGPAFADGLFLVAAAAATLLAIGATVLAGVVTARRRAYELAALEAAGVRPRVLRRSAAVEQGVLLAAGLAVGLVAGVVGSMLALPSTPFFVDQTVGPPIQHALPWGLLAGLVLTLIVVFAVTCEIVARVVSGQATAGRLREAQQ